MPEAWLRGPIPGVPSALMPAAHSLTDAMEEIDRAVSDLETAQLWLRPGGAASIGFHIRHIGGSIERLLAYARGDALTARQLASIAREAEPGEPPPDSTRLLGELRKSIEIALEAYRTANVAGLDEPRKVGRAGLPTTVHGLMFHIAEHSRRHAGQVVTTARIIRGLDLTRVAPP